MIMKIVLKFLFYYFRRSRFQLPKTVKTISPCPTVLLVCSKILTADVFGTVEEFYQPMIITKMFIPYKQIFYGISVGIFPPPQFVNGSHPLSLDELYALLYSQKTDPPAPQPLPTIASKMDSHRSDPGYVLLMKLVFFG